MSWAGFLSFARDERVVLLTIGMATFSIVSTMIAVLTVIRDDNEIPPPQPKTQYITQDTEDTLELDTLDKLLTHPNFSIREIAMKILCDRAINDPETADYLLYGITRPDYDERIKCLRALALLTSQTMGQDGLTKLNNARAYSALVRSFELSLDDPGRTELDDPKHPELSDDDRPELNDPYWDEYYLRDMAERFCLMFALDLSNKYGASMLVKARFVEKWLARQAWGNEPEERRRNFKAYMDTKNNRIVDIVTHIKRSRRGLRALEAAGLLEKENSRRHIQELPDLLMEYDGDAPEGRVEERQIPRTREQSAEEQRLRRQHREAMVLNDGTRPLGREDIIERDHGSPI